MIFWTNGKGHVALITAHQGAQKENTEINFVKNEYYLIKQR